jgi:pyridoxal/pyridoxine/pyridoxamine kinase
LEPFPQEEICFTNEHPFRQPLVVRTSFAVCFLLTTVFCGARAQDQEKKLVDRLLKPDMALQNDAQNKKFNGDGSASINKHANVATFFLHQKASSKNYSGTRDFSTAQFYSHTYRGKRTAYEVPSQQTVANSKAIYGSKTAHGVRDAPQSAKSVASHAYAGNRPFLSEGTNQKSLNRHTEPLTIEQVRELLNKNK